MPQNNESFSIRNGFMPKKVIQIESVDQILLNKLSNVVLSSISNDMDMDFKSSFIHNFLELKFEEVDNYHSKLTDVFTTKYEWFRVYELIEFIIKYKKEYIDNLQLETPLRRNTEYLINEKMNSLINFISSVNSLLEQENSGYRIIDDLIVPIIDKTEIEEIEKTLDDDDIHLGAKDHITEALKLLSNKEVPHYKGVIHESIKAIESIYRHYYGGKTLGEALKKTKNLPERFNESVEKFYIETNQKDIGIRHALMLKGREIGQEDARLYIVFACSVINYVIEKNRKNPI